MRPERAFYDLQVRFARTAARLADRPLAAALLDCTNLYVRFGAGRAFDCTHPLWAAYVRGLDERASVTEQCEWTWRYVQRCPTHQAAPAVVATVGCFSYAREPHGGVRLHFNAQTDSGMSPLDSRQLAARHLELRALIEHLREHLRGNLQESGCASSDVLVRGTSWLYNVPAYRRLFPAAYVASAQPVSRLRALSLWGQFLDRHGGVRRDAAAMLLARVERVSAFADVLPCFPLQALAVQVSFAEFQDFFDK
ncbi:hypothetical protein LMG27952_02032 [Paraburkholderia hiiakae]|uniref:Uncharacterized protein n=1 Tax=Paraburkholderia hiiakae TaxID=1081782 RepID=A0ABM8NID2_9BURK|nr:hypothetical protein [Paraburkholderia hiiakae]CAD6527462.1 hypothetical protein LMG27952_02032 [Paraburkholderia hiiakae]